MLKNETKINTIVRQTRDRQQLQLWSLVLSAVNIPHLVELAEDGWQLTVEAHLLDSCQDELRLFEEENLDWPPIKYGAAVPIIEQEPPVLPVMAALFIFYGITGPWAANSHWFATGALVRDKVVLEGEWWRLVTALTLHADPVHVVGNVFFGGLLAFFLCRHLGSGIAWLLVLFAGIAGNGINVLLHGGMYRSIGFSTAVFGMVGILSGMRLRRVGGWQETVLALGSGIGLLALMGTAGENTDLGAHLWGLVVGLCLGILVVGRRFSSRLMPAVRYQWLLFGCCLLLVVVSWRLALVA
ncbi:MAG: rhomboid family intramembrane serine protease [Desulfobulbaceae bacterium]|nr:rhomboid family intramembrane serine protease [Desulfobulbaceae bacterium]HIJ79575.1 rhomboid family intramembrane serine protease [Deltaproteobacteria bacterium]